MTIEEAIIAGCPDRITDKMKKAGVTSFSTPHDLNDINWNKIKRDCDYLISALFSTSATLSDIEDNIETRFEILDL